MGHQDDLARAKKVAGAKIGFYIHLTAYVAVNTLLVAINLATSTEHLWFKWPLLGWGVGVLVHAIVTFALTKGPVSQRRMIERDTRNSAMKKPQP
jgi:hypothetical protein